MNRDNAAFCDRINDAGHVIVDAGADDLRRVVEKMRSSGEFVLGLDRASDGGIELISTPQGTAVLGSEDSLRGNFGFRYFDPAKPAELLQISIYELPRSALCDSVENAIQIVETFFWEGELDRRFSWMIDVNGKDGMKRGNLLAVGNQLPLEAFVARIAQRTA